MLNYLDLAHIKPLKIGLESPKKHYFTDTSGDFAYTIGHGVFYNGTTIEPNDFIEFSLKKYPSISRNTGDLDKKRLLMMRKAAQNPLKHLKFHISLPETDKQEADSDFAKGFRIIVDILFKHRVGLFKVIKPDAFFQDEYPEQRGKDVTIYCKGNADFTLKHWQKILTKITSKLTEAGIRPGYRPILSGRDASCDADAEDIDDDYSRADSLIPGAKFITYRVEKGIFDPVVKSPSFKIDVPNQLEPTPFARISIPKLRGNAKF